MIAATHIVVKFVCHPTRKPGRFILHEEMCEGQNSLNASRFDI